MYPMIVTPAVPATVSSLESAAEWFALRVKPQHERTVGYALHQKGFERYVPLYRSRRRWSDRLKDIDLPLFQGVVFCRLPVERKNQVLNTPGVYSFVGNAGIPTPLAAQELQLVQRMLDASAAVSPWPYMKSGQRVRIDRGPLTGLEGILAGTQDGWHVVVNVEILQRGVAVAVARDHFVAAEAPRVMVAAGL